ncbi:MAG: hypothetical protein KGL39_38365, partial [Patescibacteria group bacterium]|nr:hypothetical protein [Patescibacteria group bacterium]
MPVYKKTALAECPLKIKALRGARELAINPRVAARLAIRYVSSMNRAVNSEQTPAQHAASFNSVAAYRSNFENALLNYLDLLPRRDRTGQRDGRRRAMIHALDNRA